MKLKPQSDKKKKILEEFHKKFFVTETPTHKGFQVELELKMLSEMESFLIEKLQEEREKIVQEINREITDETYRKFNDGQKHSTGEWGVTIGRILQNKLKSEEKA